MLYKWRQRLEHALIGTSDNTTEELEESRTSWVETAVDKVVDNKMRCTLLYLEIFHVILKQYRKLDLPGAHVGYTLYSTWIGHPQTSTWLSTFTGAHDKVKLSSCLCLYYDWVLIITTIHYHGSWRSPLILYFSTTFPRHMTLHLNKEPWCMKQPLQGNC